jgi:hypothetical protein
MTAQMLPQEIRIAQRLEEILDGGVRTMRPKRLTMFEFF